MKTYHTFATPETFQTFLRTRYANCKHGSGCLDYVNVAGVLYTMHEYDNDGKQVTWANKKKNLMLEMDTTNRYQIGYHDAEVLSYPADWLRNDISYAE
jgi:hypothetical protein